MSYFHKNGKTINSTKLAEIFLTPEKRVEHGWAARGILFDFANGYNNHIDQVPENYEKIAYWYQGMAYDMGKEVAKSKMKITRKMIARLLKIAKQDGPLERTLKK